jgi:biotin carboxyl carrier protein
MALYQYSRSGNRWSEFKNPTRPSSGSLSEATMSRDKKGIWITVKGQTFIFRPALPFMSKEDEGSLSSPMPARVIEVMVVEGDEVKEGQNLMRLEAMKMEIFLRAPEAGRIKKIKVALGDQVEASVALVEIE